MIAAKAATAASAVKLPDVLISGAGQGARKPANDELADIVRQKTPVNSGRKTEDFMNSHHFVATSKLSIPPALREHVTLGITNA